MFHLLRLSSLRLLLKLKRYIRFQSFQDLENIIKFCLLYLEDFFKAFKKVHSAANSSSCIRNLLFSSLSLQDTVNTRCSFQHSLLISDGWPRILIEKQEKCLHIDPCLADEGYAINGVI